MKKLIIVLTLIAATNVFATVKGGKFGMGFSYTNNQSLGVFNTNTRSAIGASMPTVNAVFHITDMIGVAANIGFYTTNYKDKSSISPTTGYGTWNEYSTTAWAIGLEIPLYLAKFTLLHFYVAPGFSIAPGKTTTTTTVITAAGSTTGTATSTTSYLAIYGVIGLQIPINDQFHAFGRTTIGYASGTYGGSNAAGSYVDSTDSYFGLQSWSVGGLFYFN